MALQIGPPPIGGDQNNSAGLLTAIIVLVGASTATVCLRLFTRIKIARNVGIDDYLILVAMCLNLASFGFDIVQFQNGIARHQYYLPPDQIVTVAKFQRFAEVQVAIGTSVIKISILVFLLRLMKRTSTRAMVRFIYVLIASLVVITIACLAAIASVCKPAAASWDPSVQGQCWSNAQQVNFAYGQGAWSVVMDFLCATLPIVFLWKAQIKRRKKIAICLILSLGLFSAICCVFRTVYSADIVAPDLTWQIQRIDLWGTLEENFGMIACSIPALQPLVTGGSFSRILAGLRSDLTPRRKWPGQGSRSTKDSNKGSSAQQSSKHSNDGTNGTSDQAILLPSPVKVSEWTADPCLSDMRMEMGLVNPYRLERGNQSHAADRRSLILLSHEDCLPAI